MIHLEFQSHHLLPPTSSISCSVHLFIRNADPRPCAVGMILPLRALQMLQQDMRKFSVIYFIFLFGFSHMLYITSDQQNSGYLSFFDSMRIGFQAVLQQVELNMEENQHLGPWSVKMIFIIVLANFFLVSLVLINLLIAMMSSTYDDINDASKRQWNLVRARIITNFDKEMTDKERCSEDNIFWNWEDPLRESGKRIMTFTTSENLVRYLAGECT